MVSFVIPNKVILYKKKKKSTWCHETLGRNGGACIKKLRMRPPTSSLERQNHYLGQERL